MRSETGLEVKRQRESRRFMQEMCWRHFWHTSFAVTQARTVLVGVEILVCGWRSQVELLRELNARSFLVTDLSQVRKGLSLVPAPVSVL